MNSKKQWFVFFNFLCASVFLHAAAPVGDTSYSDFVLSARAGPRICSLAVREAIARAEIDKYLGPAQTAYSKNEPLEVDYAKSKECISESVQKLKLFFVVAKKSARNNTALIKAIDTLNVASLGALLAIIPGGSEGKSSYVLRTNQSNQDLRVLGDKVIIASCKDDVGCVLNSTEKLDLP